jgi:flagellar M-ring protein FliF
VPKLDPAALKARASKVFDGFTRGQKVMLGIAAVAVLLGGYLFTTWSAAPSYTVLYSNLSPEDAGEITSQLASKGVSYELGDGGTSVLVPRSDVYQLRIDLSSQGLPKAGAAGYSLLDKQGITTSEFRQRVDYQRALEGELANTIGAITGVSTATVHLVIPKEDLFSRDASKPTASVLVQTDGSRLASGQVRGIVHLVASSVEGLAPTDVTVADGDGRVLSAPGEGGLDASGDARAEATVAFEQQLSGSLTELLVPLVGSGNAIVKVKAALDFDRRSTTSETFGEPETAPTVAESTSKETYTGADPNAAAGGILGPNGAPAAAAGGGNHENETAERSFAVDKITEQVETAPGAVERLSVAVLVDDVAEASDMADIQTLVTAAAGIDPARGDTIQVRALAFDDSAEQAADEALAGEQAAAQKSQMLDLARTVGAVLLVGLILFFSFRSARKATVHRVPIALPVGPERVDATHAPIDVTDAEALLPAPRALSPFEAPREIGSSHLADLIESQPDDVAQLLRGWLVERK